MLYTPMTAEQCREQAAKRKAQQIEKNRKKAVKREVEQAIEKNKSSIQLSIETIMMINDYSSMIREMGINKVYEIQGKADKCNNSFIYDVCATILKFNRVSDKQAFILSKFINS